VSFQFLKGKVVKGWQKRGDDNMAIKELDGVGRGQLPSRQLLLGS